MEKTEKEKELWTQQEVADYFRVAPGTIKNWRELGYLKFFQATGSSRVLLYRDDVIQFRNQHTTSTKGGDKKDNGIIKRIKPDLSATSKKQWRI